MARFLVGAGLGLIVAVAASGVGAATLPPNFQETVVWKDLTKPTAVRFAPDGRIFVAEKGGVLKVFDAITDTTPTVVADLSRDVHGYWDRGLLGLAIHPRFPAVPHLFVLYTYDAPPGKAAPYWNDTCDDATGNGCAVTARLARLELGADGKVAAQSMLLESGFCNQFPSHSIGDLTFGPDGALYVAAGDGASFTKGDTGQHGSPPNPCGDPPDEGGALRSQDLLSAEDPVTFNGAVLRLDPMTGAALPDGPLAGGKADDDRVIAFGLRNPYRMTFRPGTAELWIADVGAGKWEELNRIASVSDRVVENFGWPCFEGPRKPSSYEATALCKRLYGGGAAPGTLTPAHFAYEHGAAPDPAACGTGTGSAVTGVAFYGSGSYPASYRGALFFADHARGCIWTMPGGTGGAPDPAKTSTFVAGAAKPVDLQIGPDGDLFYVDHGGSVRRVRYFSANRPPTAAVQASAVSGAAPLMVSFDASLSADADAGDVLAFAWDLDGDGAFDDGDGKTISFSYTTAAEVTAGVRVTDREGASAVATVKISVGNTAPVAAIASPPDKARFRVGERIEFRGDGTDAQDGPIPADRLTWSLVLQHCALDGECHAHELETWKGVAAGSFVWPDHDLPSHLELVLQVRDAAGLEHTVRRRLDPLTVDVRVETAPPGLSVTVGIDGRKAPIVVTAGVGGELSLDVTSPQTLAGESWSFVGWSDGGPRTRRLVAPSAALTLVARFERQAPPPTDPSPPDAGVASDAAPARDTASAHPDGDGHDHDHGPRDAAAEAAPPVQPPVDAQSPQPEPSVPTEPGASDAGARDAGVADAASGRTDGGSVRPMAPRSRGCRYGGDGGPAWLVVVGCALALLRASQRRNARSVGR